MNFEGDPDKARSNLAKHGIAFDVAQGVWDDPLHLIVPDRIEDGEMRWHAIGMIGPVAIVLVVHLYPDEEDEDRVRVIGARKATAEERKRYEEEGAQRRRTRSAGRACGAARRSYRHDGYPRGAG